LFKRINGSSNFFEDQFWSSKSTESLYKKLEDYNEDPMANVFKAGMEFMIKNKSRASYVQERVQQALSGAIGKEMEIVEKKLTFLATVGSTTPFIGLLGTVWGIMNSFQSIANSKNTSLAVVAPGIAEALFATALGLFAAIPAVVAYNKFTSESRKYSMRLENFGQSFISIT
jgi:biopolymer transport protein TolQ